MGRLGFGVSLWFACDDAEGLHAIIVVAARAAGRCLLLTRVYGHSGGSLSFAILMATRSRSIRRRLPNLKTQVI